MTTLDATTAAGARTGGGSTLTGVGVLFRFMLRRDRIRIPAWVLGLTLATMLTAATFPGLYPSEAERQAIAATMENPAMIAMTGVNYSPEDYSYGVMMGHQMLWFTGILAGLMSILLLTRHTRAEEASGRAELLRSGVVGRHAATTAALAVVGVANIALGLLTALGLGAMGIESIDWPGSLLYGAAHAAIGLVFAGVAAVTAQVTEHSRGAASMALAVLGLAYILRAVGDLTGGALFWLSPLGWAQATEVYAANIWWPLGLAVLATAALTALAFNLSLRRDVGAGLRQPKPGPAAASEMLTNPLGFALRLHRASIIGWAIALFLLGVSYGSVLGEVEQLFADMEGVQDIFPDIAGVDFTMTFAAMITTVTAIIASAYAVLASQRMRSEETSGRAEPVLATAISRVRWAGSHLAVTMGGSAIVVLAAGLGIGGAGAISTGDPGLFPRMLGAALAYVPALWVTAGVSVLLFGLLPRAIALTWVVVVYSFVVVYLGGILQFPGWMNNLSPFGHVGQAPAVPLNILPLVVLTALAAVLIAGGLAAFRRRDLQSTT